LCVGVYDDLVVIGSRAAFMSTLVTVVTIEVRPHHRDQRIGLLPAGVTYERPSIELSNPQRSSTRHKAR
jgi:hypothetical protein